jgi:hypothetical protein
MKSGLNLQIPRRIWVEMHDKAEKLACDVIVEMENGAYYTAPFVTLPYLERQMQLSYEVSKTLPDTPAVHYAALETPHIIVTNLKLDTIEDTIDNLLALDTFESVFTQVTDDDGGKHATAEVAAVVLNEVLMVEADTTVA